MTLTGAPYPNVMQAVFAAASEGIGQMITVILDNAGANLARLDKGDSFEVAQRQQIALFLWPADAAGGMALDTEAGAIATGQTDTHERYRHDLICLRGTERADASNL